MAQTTVTCDACGEPLGNASCPACRRYVAKPTPEVIAPQRPVIPASGPVQRERRQAERQRPLIGGARQTDPPLTTRDCADWMGLSTEFIRGAIDDGALEAEDVTINGKRVLRIHLDRFVAYLRAIGWKRLPKRPGAVAADDA